MPNKDNKCTRGFQEIGPFVLAPNGNFYFGSIPIVNKDRNRTVSRINPNFSVRNGLCLHSILQCQRIIAYVIYTIFKHSSLAPDTQLNYFKSLYGLYDKQVIYSIFCAFSLKKSIIFTYLCTTLGITIMFNSLYFISKVLYVQFHINNPTLIISSKRLRACLNTEGFAD